MLYAKNLLDASAFNEKTLQDLLTLKETYWLCKYDLARMVVSLKIVY